VDPTRLANARSLIGPVSGTSSTIAASSVASSATGSVEDGRREEDPSEDATQVRA
jgi:hypothetical protein